MLLPEAKARTLGASIIGSPHMPTEGICGPPWFGVCGGKDGKHKVAALASLRTRTKARSRAKSKTPRQPDKAGRDVGHQNQSLSELSLELSLGKPASFLRAYFFAPAWALIFAGAYIHDAFLEDIEGEVGLLFGDD